MADEPTVGELMRQVEALVGQVRDVAQQLRTDYVRRDVYTASRLSDVRRIEKIEEKDEIRDKNASDTRRQLLVGLALVAATALLSILLTVNNYVGVGGGR
jgi:hypothetical protein